MIRRSHIYLVLLLLLIAPTLSFSQSVKRYAPNEIEKLLQNKTKEEIIALIGQPARASTMHGYNIIWEYGPLNGTHGIIIYDPATHSYFESMWIGFQTFQVDNAVATNRAAKIVSFRAPAHSIMLPPPGCRTLEMINGVWVCNAPPPDHPSRIPFR